MSKIATAYKAILVLMIFTLSNTSFAESRRFVIEVNNIDCTMSSNPNGMDFSFGLYKPSTQTQSNTFIPTGGKGILAINFDEDTSSSRVLYRWWLNSSSDKLDHISYVKVGPRIGGVLLAKASCSLTSNGFDLQTKICKCNIT